jgi:hypothetical protein
MIFSLSMSANLSIGAPTSHLSSLGRPGVPAGGEPQCFDNRNIFGQPDQYMPFDIEDEQLGLM